jgi:hypothetical protein
MNQLFTKHNILELNKYYGQMGHPDTADNVTNLAAER